MLIIKFLDKEKYQWEKNKKSYNYLLYKAKVKLNKKNGEEVAFFIEGFLEKHDLDATQKNVSSIETSLHLSDVLYKNELIAVIENDFEFGVG
ncbi:MAG: Unknown protein [uncultured Sulfurovum sp.]|uniref:Uncharacterized protein n=1 Tax=uncultured Sulfurovum sp. TaxID=269237 RepID=A0A6S6S4I2_9BACT|nr:MAG: Unknown protein [uncultured Sulfurovum sp.]